MNNIYIYFGPKKGFDTFLSERKVDFNAITSFSLLVKRSDERSKEIRVVKEHGEEELEKTLIEVAELVVYSDEYASVKEHVILNFDGFLSFFSIENLYLQNPPELLYNKIKQTYPDAEIAYYNYPLLSEELIVKINSDYNEMIIGQNQALNQLLISLVPLTRSTNKKPVVLLFWGPSGVGKTETAKFLADCLGGELFRKQMSMYQNNDFATYLFGGQYFEKSFAKELLDRETNVILLDEFDKANSVFHSAFYQLFDEGVYQDKNYNVKVGSSIIICTSNYTSLDHIQEHLGEPIFLRFDACIEFVSLGKESVKRIIDLHIDQELETLDDTDKAICLKNEIELLFEDKTHRFENARRIRSLVKEVINSKILNRILDQK